MIELLNIDKRFDDKVIFNDFSLTIPDGEFIVISGVSGCGKTTLLNIAGGIEKPDKGQVLVDGIDIYNKRNSNLFFREKAGFLFQNYVLIEDKTVEENLKMIQKKSRTGLSIEEALERVGLEDKLKSKVYSLSGGEQQRVALARLMLKKCSVIYADEPTGSLDKDNADRVMAILKDLNKEGKTILLVSHDEDIKRRGDRICYI